MSHYRLGRHDRQADFTGVTSGNVTLTHRPDAIAFDNLQAFCLGPVAIGDVSENITSHSWYVRADNVLKQVFISRENDTGDGWLAEAVLFSFAGEDLIEIDLAFEQAGRPFVCASRATGLAGAREVWLYWFNPVTSLFEFVSFGLGRTPRCLIDNPLDAIDSDIMIFYVNDLVGGVCYRQQRDRYAIEYPTPLIQGAEASPGIFLPVVSDLYVEDVIRTTDNRMSVLCSAHSGGRYDFRALTSSLYPFFPPAGEMQPANPTFQDSIGIEFVIIVLTQPGEDPHFPNSFTMPDENLMGVSNPPLTFADLVTVVFPPIVPDTDPETMKAVNPILFSGFIEQPLVIYDSGINAEDLLKSVNPTLQSALLATIVLVYDSGINAEDLLKAVNPTLQSGTLA